MLLARRRGGCLLAIGFALSALALPASAASADPPSLRASGGWIKDGRGRVAILRGTNLDVGLRRPSAATDLSESELAAHARAMARMGFNLVRLQLTWAAIEPGNLPANHSSICSPGPGADPGQWDRAHARRYLDRVERVVRTMRRHGIMTLFQIAQYAYNESFGGPPSHPDWAVCTNGVPITRGPGPSAYAQPGVSVAAEHFWRNDVRGDLQGEYQRMLRAIARRFKDQRSIAGYELYNEPFAPPNWLVGGRLDTLAQCFYMGAGRPGRLADGSVPNCPQGVPVRGAIPAVRAIDRRHLLHPQPHIYTNFGIESGMGPMPADGLVFNFHAYCPSGLGVQTVPDRIRGPECETTERSAFEEAERARRAMASRRQPRALPGFLSEFGFGDNEEMLRHMTGLADKHLLGWAYFTWRNHEGPDHEGIVRNADGSLRPKARLLARPYPRALAGRPLEMSYEPDEREFSLAYRPWQRGKRRASIIALPRLAYGRDGVCVNATSARARVRADELRVLGSRSRRDVRLDVSPRSADRRC